MNYLTLLAAQATGKGSSWTMILMMVAVFAVMYFLMIRPQKKKQKEEQAMRDNLQIGDEITTIGGIVGTITERDGDTVKVLVDEKNGTTITIVIYAVQQVIRSAKQSEVPSPSSPEA